MRIIFPKGFRIPQYAQYVEYEVYIPPTSEAKGYFQKVGGMISWEDGFVPPSRGEVNMTDWLISRGFESEWIKNRGLT